MGLRNARVKERVPSQDASESEEFKRTLKDF